jgi:hypothetical protein
MDAFEPPKYITSLIAAINDGAKSAQTGALAFAAIGLYLLATAFSATDEDLLLDRTLAISQLSAQIPVTVSFAMMPILFVALHVFTLIRYDMLAANVRQFSADLATKCRPAPAQSGGWIARCRRSRSQQTTSAVQAPSSDVPTRSAAPRSHRTSYPCNPRILDATTGT